MHQKIRLLNNSDNRPGDESLPTPKNLIPLSEFPLSNPNTLFPIKTSFRTNKQTAYLNLQFKRNKKLPETIKSKDLKSKTMYQKVKKPINNETKQTSNINRSNFSAETHVRFRGSGWSAVEGGLRDLGQFWGMKRSFCKLRTMQKLFDSSFSAPCTCFVSNFCSF